MTDPWITRLRNQYFWSLVRMVEPGGKEHSELLSIMFNMDYHYDNCMDENRAADGMKLREDYLAACNNDAKVRVAINVHSISVFEVLLALAQRIEDDVMQEDELGDRSPMWFWSMIRNVGLYDCTNSSDRINDGLKIFNTLQTALSRDFDECGHGGFFPVEYPPSDMRDSDLWGQAMCWLVENFSAH